ncbi:MAG: permease [Dehalococcoidia bacterium]
MVDVQATLFRFQQFLIEFGPLFLASWLGLAIAAGLAALASERRLDVRLPGPLARTIPFTWLRRLMSSLLWRSTGAEYSRSKLGGMLIFGFAASFPALVVTSLIDVETVFIRLGMAAFFALCLGWLVTLTISRKQVNLQEQRAEARGTSQGLVSQDEGSAFQSGGLRRFAEVTWKSFSGQVDGALIPVVIGFVLASALTIYVPSYAIRPWLGDGAWQGPYLAAVLVVPFQLAGGADVPLASALLVKGASMGVVLSVMLAAPSSTFIVLRGLYRSLSLKSAALYLVAVWLVAGSLGTAVNVVKGLFDG